MMSFSIFKKWFPSRDFPKELPLPNLPNELEKLTTFQDAGRDYYSTGFELSSNDGKGMLHTYSIDEEFQKQFYAFAFADGTGSQYMFWLTGDAEDFSIVPIVVFGSEGGVHVVASNFREFLKLLSFDAEPMVDWDRVIYYKSDEDEPSKRHQDYITWLAKFDIFKTDDPKNILEDAQVKYQEPLNALIKAVMK